MVLIRRREAEESASQREKEIIILKENLDEAINKLNALQRLVLICCKIPWFKMASPFIFKNVKNYIF